MTSVQTILHPTNFSHHADKAFQAACSLEVVEGALSGAHPDDASAALAWFTAATATEDRALGQEL